MAIKIMNVKHNLTSEISFKDTVNNLGSESTKPFTFINWQQNPLIKSSVSPVYHYASTTETYKSARQLITFKTNELTGYSHKRDGPGLTCL